MDPAQAASVVAAASASIRAFIGFLPEFRPALVSRKPPAPLTLGRTTQAAQFMLASLSANLSETGDEGCDVGHPKALFRCRRDANARFDRSRALAPRAKSLRSPGGQARRAHRGFSRQRSGEPADDRRDVAAGSAAAGR